MYMDLHPAGKNKSKIVFESWAEHHYMRPVVRKYVSFMTNLKLMVDMPSIEYPNPFSIVTVSSSDLTDILEKVEDRGSKLVLGALAEIYEPREELDVMMGAASKLRKLMPHEFYELE